MLCTLLRDEKANCLSRGGSFRLHKIVHRVGVDSELICMKMMKNEKYPTSSVLHNQEGFFFYL